MSRRPSLAPAERLALRALRARRWMLIGMLLGLLVVSAAVFSRPGVYTATAAVELSAVPPAVDLGPPGAVPQSVTIDTDAQMLLSDEVVDAVARATGHSPAHVRTSLRLSARPLTRVLQIHYTDGSATVATRGADSAAVAFLAKRDKSVLAPLRASLQHALAQTRTPPVSFERDTATRLAAPQSAVETRRERAILREAALPVRGVILEHARTTPRPERPNVEVPLASGGAAGALLGLGVALLRQRHARRAAPLLAEPTPWRPRRRLARSVPRRRLALRVLVYCTLLGALGYAAGAALAARVPSRPTGTATMLVRPLPGDAYAVRRADNLVDLRTEAEFVRSDAVLAAAVGSPGLPDTPAVRDLRSRLRVGVVPNSEIVSVSVRAPTRAQAAAEATRVANAALTIRQARAERARSLRVTTLRRHFDQVRGDLVKASRVPGGTSVVEILSLRANTLEELLRSEANEDVNPGSLVSTSVAADRTARRIRAVLPASVALTLALLGLRIARRPRWQPERVADRDARSRRLQARDPVPAAGRAGAGVATVRVASAPARPAVPPPAPQTAPRPPRPAPPRSTPPEAPLPAASPVPGPAERPEPPQFTEVERMARAGGLSLAGAAVSAVAGVALTAVITNGFAPAVAGTIFATTSLFVILVGVVQLGTEVGLVRAVPAAVARGERHRVGAILRTALIPVAALSTLAAVAVYLFADTVARLVTAGSPAAAAQQIRVLAVFLPVAALFNVTLAATRGLRTMTPTVVLEALARSLVQLAFVAAVVVLEPDALTAVTAWALPYAPALAIATVWLAALLRRRRARVVVPPADPSDHAGATILRSDRVSRDFWRFTGPRAIGTISQIVLKRADIVMVAALRSPREAALYAAATRFVVLGQLGVQALQQAMSPQLSALFAREDHDGVRDVYRATTAWSMLLAWPIYLGCAVMAPLLLQFFGPGYDRVANVVVVLSLAMLAATACGAVDSVLLMSGHTWLSLGNNVFALAINIALNLVLIPRYGVLGAGVAWMVAIVVRNVLPLVQIAFSYRISPFGRQTALVAVAAVTCFGLVPTALRLAGHSTSSQLVALGIGAVGYLLVVRVLRRELRLDAFAAVVRRRRGRGTDGAQDPLLQGAVSQSAATRPRPPVR